LGSLRKLTAMRRLLILFSLVFAFTVSEGQYAGFVAGSNEPLYGAEMITDGDFPDNTNWTEGAGWVIGGNVATYDDVTDDARLTQVDGDMVSSVATGTNYKLTFDMVCAAGNARLRIINSAGTNVYVATAYYATNSYEILFTTGGWIDTGGFGVGAYDGSSGTFTITNISLKPQL